jgi:hypothetical protein
MSEFPPLSCNLAAPLVIDLEGSLVPTETLHEALFLLLKRDWSRAWRVGAVWGSCNLPQVHWVRSPARSRLACGPRARSRLERRRALPNPASEARRSFGEGFILA